MITDSEFLIIRNYDRNLAEAGASAQAIIDRKNRLLTAADREILRLQEALRVETGKRRHAELQLAQARRH